MNWELIADIASLVFILFGSLQVFFAAVGVVRFNNTVARIHAITKPQTTGLLLVVMGTIIRLAGSPTFDVGHRGDAGMLLLLLLFALMTSPVVAQRLGRVSRLEGLYGGEDQLTVNENPSRYKDPRPTKPKP
ncbi:monovalent cation/H(+) antiporter subunit G [Corynebacterium aquatimens]|uniref:Multicomponent Na+:H+ antiporter subunit G n=1 Tax=Corynebacterium aquatimens TaxID=1190508 RepID=A0A931E175_9CORY|nr:monovalent cation/H(+) antiporter subunit G [Corynebacterium aquatimens]MBG6122378.1 multicomponent Na+:H+ antiporter subunit G [Corynebacterium aquatimens]WJY65079.1 Na(+)/H(+) antiporter subunit G [Corynebacterium aquatimens]